jgi:hypothetical protein
MNSLIRVVWAGLLLVVMAGSSVAYAEFDLNFSAQDSVNNTMMDYVANGDNGASPDTGQTPFLWNGGQFGLSPEIVTDPTNGNKYYHMIIGDFASGFIQESYVQMGFGSYGNSYEPASPSRKSASDGTGTYDPLYLFPSSTTFGNGYDPLDMNKNAKAQNVTSGNGTGNPTRVIMRQIMTDGEIMTEFLKDQYANKPRISQMLVAPDIYAEFDIDMRSISFSDATSVAPMTNTIQLYVEALPFDTGYYDTAVLNQNSTYNAGRYIYTDGAGPGGSSGTYNYESGGFDQTAQDWKGFFDANVSNPWTFEEAKP